MSAALNAAIGPQVGKVLSSGADPDPRLVADMLGAYAMTGMLLNDAAYQTLAIQSLMATLTWSDWGFGTGDDLDRAHMITSVAIAYDVLYGLLSTSQRSEVATRLGAEAQLFSTDVTNGIWWATEYLQNHNWVNMAALGLAGYALNGDDPRAAGWIQQANANAAKVTAALSLITDGSWHEGVGYQQYGWSMAMPYWLAAAQQGVDVSDTQPLRAYGQYWMAIQLPDQGREYIATHGDWSGWATPGASQLLRYAAAKYQDPLAAEAATRWIAAGPRSTIASDAFYLDLEMIAFDPNVAGIDPNTLPLEFYAADQQLAVARSNWTSGALVLGVKSGELGGSGNFQRLQKGGYPGGGLDIGHDHNDDGAFWLYGDNEWLLPECVGYNIGTSSGPLAFQSVFHNTLLFDGTGELGDDKVSDNGLGYSWFFQRQAHLSIVADTTDYAFVQADATQLYPTGDNLQSLLRTFVLARDGYVVLNDTVSMSATHQVDQVFHFLTAASQSGSWLRGDAPNDRTLGIAVVSPASFSAKIGSQSANNLAKQFDPSGTEATVELHASTAASSAQFLELLWPTRGSLWSQKPSVTPLDTARPESGFTLVLPTGTETWLYAPGGSGAAGSFVLTGQIGIVRAGTNGTLQRIVQLGAGDLADQNGTRTLMQSTQAGVIEVSFQSATTAVVSGADPSGLRFYGPGITQVFVHGEPATFSRDGSMIVLGTAPAAPDAGTSVPSDPQMVGGTNTGGSSSGSPEGATATHASRGGCNSPASDAALLSLVVALTLLSVRRHAMRCRRA
jgi:hypothetical protein